METKLQVSEVMVTDVVSKIEDIILTKTVTAGKRIYYLDVKRNSKGEYYIVLTESKKVKIYDEDGNESIKFEKHKIFLYKEDFDNFSEAYSGIVEFTKNANLGV